MWITRYIIASIVEFIGCLLLLVAIGFYEAHGAVKWLAGKLNVFANNIAGGPE